MSIDLKVKNNDGTVNTIASLLELSNELPKTTGLNEAPSAGSSNLAARSDHKHTITMNNTPRATKYSFGVVQLGNGINADTTGIIYTNSRLNGQGYISCTTASNTAAKVASLSDYILQNGSRVAIVFTNKDTAGNITLNINSTGAKNINLNPSTRITTAGFFNTNTVYSLVYDGSKYILDGIYPNSLIEDSSSTSVSITLINNYDYIYSSELSSLDLTFPTGSSNQDTIKLKFKSGSTTATSVTLNGSNFICNPSTFTPVSDKSYIMEANWFSDKWMVKFTEF